MRPESRIETLPAARVVADGRFQHRLDGTDLKWVAELLAVLKAGGTFCDRPVVFEEADGTLVLGGGFHRHAAAADFGGEIEWEVRPGGRAAAFRYSLGDNADHGRQRSAGDVKTAARAAVADPGVVADCQHKGELSARKLAALIRCDASYLSTVLRDLGVRQKDASKANKPKPAAAGDAGTPHGELLTEGDEVGPDAGGDSQAEPRDGAVEPGADLGAEPAPGPRGDGEGVGPAVGKPGAAPVRHTAGQPGGNAGVPAEHATGGGVPAVPGRPPACRDRLGRLVPKHLIPVFEEFAPALRAAAAKLAGTLAAVKKLDKDDAGGGFLAALPGWTDALAEERDRLLGEVPWVVCPACERGDGGAGRCPTCYGAGWLRVWEYEERVRPVPYLDEEANRHAPGDAFEVDTTDLVKPSLVGKPLFVPKGPGLDALGDRVPERLRDAFAGDRVLAEWQRECHRLAVAVKSATNWNPHIPPRVRVGLEQASHDLRDARPWAVCPRCKGKKCEACMTAGWLPAGDRDTIQPAE